MSHRQPIVGLGIYFFNNIYFERIYNIFKDFKTHRCALEFDSLFLRLLEKENK